METIIVFSYSDLMRALPNEIFASSRDEKIGELYNALHNDALGIWNYTRRLDEWDWEENWDTVTDVDDLRDYWNTKSIIIFEDKKHLVNLDDLDDEMRDATQYISREDAQRQCQELDAVEQLKKDLNILWQDHLYDEKIIGFHLTDNKKIEKIFKKDKVKHSKNVFIFDHRINN